MSAHWADLIDIYAMLPQKVSFLECFWRSHVYFIRYRNKPTEITRNHFWDVFLKHQKYFREMFLRRHGEDIFFEICPRRLKGVTKKTSFLRCIWDVLKTSPLRCFWEIPEISLSMEIWLRSLRDISCRLGK